MAGYEYYDFEDSDASVFSPEKEYMRIKHTLLELELSMQKYIDDIKYIWDNTFVSFLDSADCVTMQNLRTRDFDKFTRFMTEQKTYRIMRESHRRLLNRQMYLTNILQAKHKKIGDNDNENTK